MFKTLTYYLFLILFFNIGKGMAQVETRQELEKKRLELQKEITRINQQLANTKRSESTALIEYNQIKRKVFIRQRLINTLRKEINAINHNIQKTNKQIHGLEKELDILKKNYADMIRHSYNSRSREDKLYFLFSSENFQQAYKRMQYLKQYTKYREQQAIKIEKKKTGAYILKN